MLVMIALLLPILLFLVAMAVDVGYIQLVRTEMRASTDAATRAAGEALSRTQDLNQARQAAKDLAVANKVASAPLLLADSDIEFGLSTLNADGSWTFNPSGSPINAVRIHSKRTKGSLSGSVPLYFGRFMGINDFEPRQIASSVRLDRDICLVIDRSTSMKLPLSSTSEWILPWDPRLWSPPFNDSRWKPVETAVYAFVAELEKTPHEEHVSLVSFASSMTLAGIVNTDSDIDQVLHKDSSKVLNALDLISDRAFNGYTNIAAGIANGVNALTDSSKARPFAGKTMIVLTDGVPTAGGSPVAAAQAAALKNITIHTITFGQTTDQGLMMSVASVTGGKHFHAPDAAKLTAIFKEIAQSLPVILTK
jgi:hypothetical protein